MKTRPWLSAAALFLAGTAHAVTLNADGQWALFDVDELTAASGGLEWIDLFDGGAPLSFEFTVPSGFFGVLTVVDGGFAGDRFLVTSGNMLLGPTSLPTASHPASVGLDFDAALDNPAYSRGSFTLGAGSHDITGYLVRSASADGVPLNATVGAVRLQVSPVPEPSTLLTLLAGLGAIGLVILRRTR
jgi:hypothetical protein